MIREIPVIAFDGTHSSGKTTLKYSVASALKENGINCVELTEPARNSPLVDDVVLRDLGQFDLPLELDLIADHISRTIRALRHAQVILADRTPANVIAYTRILVDLSSEKDIMLFHAAVDFVKQWLKIYDLVFYCQDHYSIDLQVDPMRNKVINLQNQIDLQTQAEYAHAEINLNRIPKGLSNNDRTMYVLDVLSKNRTLLKK